MRIQHNIMAMNSYRNYTNNVSAMKKNLEKLSSGYKINRAGDDAAGLAISEKMRAQITGLETAQKNAKDGISLVQTAEGALTEVHDMLNRMIELATQSANGTYDNTTDRYQLQKEVDQLRSEIDRIADSSNFNGIQLLDGSMEVGSNNLSKVDLTNIHDATTALTPEKTQFTINFKGFSATPSAGAVAKGGAATPHLKIKIGGTEIKMDSGSYITVDSTMDGTELAQKIYDAIVDKNGASEIKIGDMTYDVAVSEDGMLQFTAQDYPAGKLTDTELNVSIEADKAGNFVAGVGDKKNNPDADGNEGTDNTNLDGDDNLTLGNNGHGVQVTFQKLGAPAAGGVLASAKFDLENVKDGTALRIGDVTYVFAVGATSKYKSLENVVDLTRYTGNEADFDSIAAAWLSKAAESNAAVKVEASGKTNTLVITEKEGGLDRTKWDVYGADDEAMDDASWKSLAGDFVQKGTITGNGLTLQIGDTAANYNQLRVSVGDCHVTALGLDTISIADQDSAASAIDAIRSAINQVSNTRGTLGATQNRLEHTINNLSVMQENIQDAESTIRDVDIAEEMMAYTKNNILIQSAQAMLAQANQIPQGVLQLLQ